jgi:hypothetical protein
MDNVPVRVSSSPAGRDERGAHADAPKVPKRKKSFKRGTMIIGAAVLVVVLALAGWFMYHSSTANAIDTSKYQAVFFTNSQVQVYFGKLQQVGDNYKLTDVFYIQPQDASATKDTQNPQDAAATQSTDLKLVKLGSEIHGPTDEIIINKAQVLFFENLKKDGKVSASIDKYNSTKPQ